MSHSQNRAIVVVLDGCGAGAAPDAAEFGDVGGPSTVRHVWEKVGGFHAPTLERVGFLAACGIGDASMARFGRLRELSKGKDSVTGHWEMMGVVTEAPFPTYPEGFPVAVIKEFEKKIGRQTIGNVPTSGTEIVNKMGALHVERGMPIVYTSADSVFQIACHEEVVPIEELYEMCRTARAILVPPQNVQRVIARPFVGDAVNGFERTERRKDFPLPPPKNFAFDHGSVYGVGVVPELFDGQGFRATGRTQSNAEHEIALDAALQSGSNFIFANFEDFDMKFGHRNDPVGFAKCLEEFDAYLATLVGRLKDGDLLILTADHGNDPTDESTDHTREYVPVALVGSEVRPGRLGDRDSLACVGATVAAHLGMAWSYDSGEDLK